MTPPASWNRTPARQAKLRGGEAVTQQWSQPTQPQWGRPPQPGFGGFPGQGNPYASGPVTYSPVPSYGPGPAGPFGPGPGPGPRRRNPLRALLLAVIAVAVVAVAALMITGLFAEPSQGAYQNDDYRVPPPDTNPPPIPIPQTDQEVVQWTEANAIYTQIMPAPVRCPVQPIDVQNASEAVLQAHFDGLVECLVRAWQPPVTDAGFIIIRPTVTIYGDSVTTKCGDSGINAFWCSADQQIYFSSQLPDRLSALRGKWAADVVMAHEFGHLVQGRTGLFAAGIIASQSTGSEKEGLIFRRRLETQADCFSGTFIRSVSTSLNIQQTDVEEILNSYKVVGDDAGSGDPNVVGDHGLSRSRLYWATWGWAPAISAPATPSSPRTTWSASRAAATRT